MRLVASVESAPLACQPGYHQRCVLPCDQAAVVDDAVLHKDAALLVCLHPVPRVVPVHLGGVVHVGGRALERQAVSMENHLSLWGDQLEQRELQRPSCRKKTTTKQNKEKKITINFSHMAIVRWDDYTQFELLRSSCENANVRDMATNYPLQVWSCCEF